MSFDKDHFWISDQCKNVNFVQDNASNFPANHIYKFFSVFREDNTVGPLSSKAYTLIRSDFRCT